MSSRLRRSKHTPAAAGGSWIHPVTRWSIYHRDGFLCCYCASMFDLTIDHFVSVERGGTNKPSNLLTCCLKCNSAKQTKTVSEYLQTPRMRAIWNVEPAAALHVLKLQLRIPLDRVEGRVHWQHSRSTRFGVLAHPGAWNGQSNVS